mmetsp:Transcript_52103/g.140206  ORF Transcript_52103/g.140206 Transcript_52103/m.140206 type:complete len:322 (-) Transcript_52103:15-980(-)
MPDSAEPSVFPLCLAYQEHGIMTQTHAEELGRRIKQPWRVMNQLRGLDWARVRRRVQCRLDCDSSDHIPVVQVRADENGMLTLANEDAAHEWLVANLICGKLNAVLIDDHQAHSSFCTCGEVVSDREGNDGSPETARQEAVANDQTCDLLSEPVVVHDRGEAASNRDGNYGSPETARQHAVASDQTRDLLSEPVVVHDGGKWLEGTIDAQSVRLLHGRKSPTWPKVLKYSIWLQKQADSGSSEGPPPVQISRHPLDGDWTGHDGAHRLYAALLSGLPLRCRWKPIQRTWKDLDAKERERLLAIDRRVCSDFAEAPAIAAAM